MALLAALTSIAGDPIQIHKKVGWNDIVRSFPFQMFQLISEHITYGYVECMPITLFLHLAPEI